MPMAVEFIAAAATAAGTAIGGTTGAFLIMNSAAVAYTIIAAATPALGSANRRQAARRARGRQ